MISFLVLLDGEFAGSQSCAGWGENWDKQSAIDGLLLKLVSLLTEYWGKQWCTATAGALKWSFCYSKVEQKAVCTLIIEYPSNLYGQLDEQSVPGLRGAWKFWLRYTRIPVWKSHPKTVMLRGRWSDQRKHVSHNYTYWKVWNSRMQ